MLGCKHDTAQSGRIPRAEFLKNLVFLILPVVCYQQLAAPACDGQQHSLPINSTVLAYFPCHATPAERLRYLLTRAPFVVWDILRLRRNDTWVSRATVAFALRFASLFLLPSDLYSQVVAPALVFFLRADLIAHHLLMGPNHPPSGLALQSIFGSYPVFDLGYFVSLLGIWRVNVALELAHCAAMAAGLLVLCHWHGHLVPGGVNLAWQMATRALVTCATMYLSRANGHWRGVRRAAAPGGSGLWVGQCSGGKATGPDWVPGGSSAPEGLARSCGGVTGSADQLSRSCVPLEEPPRGPRDPGQGRPGGLYQQEHGLQQRGPGREGRQQLWQQQCQHQPEKQHQQEQHQREQEHQTQQQQQQPHQQKELLDGEDEDARGLRDGLGLDRGREQRLPLLQQSAAPCRPSTPGALSMGLSDGEVNAPGWQAGSLGEEAACEATESPEPRPHLSLSTDISASATASPGAAASTSAVPGLPVERPRIADGGCGGAAAAATVDGASTAVRAATQQRLPPYRTFIRRHCIRYKIPWAEPEQLTPGYEQRLRELVAAQGYHLAAAYVRRGCVELTLVLEEARGASGLSTCRAAGDSALGVHGPVTEWPPRPPAAAPVVRALGLVPLLAQLVLHLGGEPAPGGAAACSDTEDRRAHQYDDPEMETARRLGQVGVRCWAAEEGDAEPDVGRTALHQSVLRNYGLSGVGGVSGSAAGRGTIGVGAAKAGAALMKKHRPGLTTAG